MRRKSRYVPKIKILAENINLAKNRNFDRKTKFWIVWSGSWSEINPSNKIPPEGCAAVVVATEMVGIVVPVVVASEFDFLQHFRSSGPPHFSFP